MLEQVYTLNKECYKQQLQFLSSINTIKLLSNAAETKSGSSTSDNRLLCANEKEYMAGTASFFMNLLLMIRDDKKLFSFLVSVIEQDQTFDANYLDTLANDLVGLFFTDFVSDERGIINALRQFQPLLKVFFSCVSDILSCIRAW